MKTYLKSIFALSLLMTPSLGDNPSFSDVPVLIPNPPPQPAVFPPNPNETLTIGNPVADQSAANEEAFREALASFEDPSEDMTTLYTKMGNQPIWFFQGNLMKCGRIAIETLQKSADDGLNPHDYEDAIESASNPKDWIKTELLLTKRFLEYINHIRVGRIDPMRISRDIKFHSPKTHPVELLIDAIHDKPSECKKLRHMAPAFPQYAQLKKILARYRVLAKEISNWPKIKAAKPFKLGDKNPEIKILREILTLHGDLSDDEKITPTFDKELDKALKQFQMRHTLEPDGIVSTKTVEALNKPIDDLIRKVLINMERLRWLPEELGDKHIIVNVAGYQVQAYEQSDLKLTIPAIVGRPSRRTPLFYAPLKNVIVNPSWGVPYNILVHDKIPKIINDPDYVRRSGFTVTDDSGSVIDPDEADWENEGSHYHLRQSPGRHNALGRIKFNIENPYTIYMHGTPEEKLFQKRARAFSSGCIRLKTPTDLAVWVLNDPDKWSQEDLQNSVHMGSTKTIGPKDNISVYFTYQTIWMGDDGLVHISDDPYRMDPKMEKVLVSND